MTDNMICPVCKKAGKMSKVKIIGHAAEITPPWDYDEQGHMIERAVTVKIECDRGHQTDALLKTVLSHQEQVTGAETETQTDSKDQ